MDLKRGLSTKAAFAHPLRLLKGDALFDGHATCGQGATKFSPVSESLRVKAGHVAPGRQTLERDAEQPRHV